MTSQPPACQVSVGAFPATEGTTGLMEGGSPGPFHLAPAAKWDPSNRFDVGWRLGATMYIPGSRATLAEDVRRCAAHAIKSVVLCLEDSIEQDREQWSIENVRHAVGTLAKDHVPTPMVFVRPRNVMQARQLDETLASPLVNGLALPKFGPLNGASWFDLIHQINSTRDRPLFAMPILESLQLVNDADRGAWLRACHDVLGANVSDICAVRIGVVDLCGYLAIRRPATMTAYDIAPIGGAISGILGEFATSDDVPVVCGGVWEHLPVRAQDASRRRVQTTRGDAPATVSDHDDVTFRQEIMQDRVHGLVGKSIIHPSQAAHVHAHLPARYEEWLDAHSVLNHDGATRSLIGNRMNEAGPHRRWAWRTLLRAHHWGVLKEGADAGILARTDFSALGARR